MDKPGSFEGENSYSALGLIENMKAKTTCDKDRARVCARAAMSNGFYPWQVALGVEGSEMIPTNTSSELSL